jgi:hypothetical protein
MTAIKNYFHMLFKNEEKKAPDKRDYLSQLPDEILMRIFSFLSAIDLQSASEVCKRIHLITSDNALWKTHVKETENSEKQYLKEYRRGVLQRDFDVISKVLLFLQNKGNNKLESLQEFFDVKMGELKKLPLISKVREEKVYQFLEGAAEDLIKEHSLEKIYCLLLQKIKFMPDPHYKEQLIFLFAVMAQNVSFLRSLIQSERALSITDALCKQVSLEAPLNVALHNRDHDMLIELLNGGYTPQVEHLTLAIFNADLKSIEILLKNRAPLHGIHFLNAIANENATMFDQLCGAAIERAEQPIKWNYYINAISFQLNNIEPEKKKEMEEKLNNAKLF